MWINGMLQFLRTAMVPFLLAWKGVKLSILMIYWGSIGNWSKQLLGKYSKILNSQNSSEDNISPESKVIPTEDMNTIQHRISGENFQRFYLSYVTGRWYFFTDGVWLKDVQNAIRIFLYFRWISIKFVRYSMMISVELQSLLTERSLWDSQAVTLSSRNLGNITGLVLFPLLFCGLFL